MFFRTVKIRKKKITLASFIGHPHNSLFQVEPDGKIVRIDIPKYYTKDQPEAEGTDTNSQLFSDLCLAEANQSGDDEDEGEDEGEGEEEEKTDKPKKKDNRNLFDTNTAQKVSGQEIEKLKEEG